MPRHATMLSARSRRALVTTGAGWILSATGLRLPAAIDEAQARKGKNSNHGNKDKNGDRSKSGSKNEKKKEAKVRAKSFKGVTITFVNGTTSSDVRVSRYGTQTERAVSPGEQISLSAPGSVQHEVATIITGRQSYLVYAQNPMVGLPWVKILDRTTDGLVFNEDLEEGEQVSSDLFRLRRNADSAEAKEFVLTLLRAPDSGDGSANATTLTTAEAGQGGNEGKGKKDGKGKKGNKKQRNQDKARGNDRKDQGAEVQAQSLDIALTVMNRSSAAIGVQEFVSDGSGTATTRGGQDLYPGETANFVGSTDGINLTVERASGDLVRIEARNPWIGRPYVRIRDDQGTDKSISLSEGESTSISGFEVARTMDDDNYKRLALTVLD